MHRFIVGALLASFAITAAIASGDGTAVGVKPQATVKISSGQKTLTVGDDISVGDRVVTGGAGQVQILFSDQTRLVVGPGSSLLIEQYLLRGDGTAQKLAIKALGGTFRFISGHSPKSAYQINTPTAAIAVRGTKFDFIASGSETLVMLYQGALTACAPGRKCVDLNNKCEIAQTARNSATAYEKRDPDRLPLADNFRFAKLQATLLSDFRISGAGNCLAPERDEIPESLGTMGTDGSDTNSDGTNLPPSRTSPKD